MPKLVDRNVGSQPHQAAAVAEAAQVALNFGQSSARGNWSTAPPSPHKTPGRRQCSCVSCKTSELQDDPLRGLTAPK